MKKITLVFCVLTFSLSTWAQVPLTIKKSFEIGSGKYSVDGGKFIDYQCKKMGLFQNLKYKDKTLDITCIDQEEQTLKIGDQIIVERGGDAGDAWDKQAIIFPNADNEFIILVKSFSSHSFSFECDTMTKEELKKEKLVCPTKKMRCNEFNETFKWNEKAKKYTSFAYLNDYPKMQLKTPDYYLKFCTEK